EAPLRSAGMNALQSPSISCIGRRGLTPRPERHLGPCSGGVFPLCFGRQAIELPFLFAKPLAKGNGIVPAASGDSRVFLERSLEARSELLELFDSNFSFRDPEGSTDGYLMNG